MFSIKSASKHYANGLVMGVERKQPGMECQMFLGSTFFLGEWNVKNEQNFNKIILQEVFFYFFV